VNQPRHAERDAILASLTDVQRAAVEHVDGPLLILAGPGSGKTRVITHRVAHLLTLGVSDRRIVALTFTNKAADEMRHRVERLVPANQVWLGTFHRFCAQLLRRYASLVGLQANFSILDASDSRTLLQEAIEDVGIADRKRLPAQIGAAISWSKNELITASEYEPAAGHPVGTLVAQVYPQYQQRLLEANAVDFDDLLMWVAVLLRENPELRQTLDERYQYVMVDEYQDTNLAQYTIVRALSVDYPNLAVTGDPDQSIYGWRGATIRNILEFERDFPRVRVVRLEQNYRSTKRILHAADQLISNNLSRKEKTLHTDNGEGKPVRIVVFPTGRDEADAIAGRIANELSAGLRRARDYAIFYRTNALTRLLERSLRSVGVPYQIVRGLEFYQRKEVKDIVAYLQLLNNPSHDVAFLRVINTPPRGIGKATLRRIAAYARQHRLPFLAAVRKAELVNALSKRPAAAIAQFAELLDRMRPRGSETVRDVILQVLNGTQYRDWIAGEEREEDLQRLANVEELVSDASEFDETHPDDLGGLEAFLEQASLVADVDRWDAEPDRVTLMTLHAAKGLEFPVVFIVALEDGILPHERSREHDEQLEEERRLLFVGMTRAEEELHLSAVRLRSQFGSDRAAAPSGFLMELPREEMEVFGPLDPLDEWEAVAMEADEWVDDWPGPVLADDPSSDQDAWQADPDPGLAGAVRRGKRNGRKGPATRAAIRLMTAAEMVGGEERGAVVPLDAFHAGMVVSHPEYGLGKIVALAGAGPKRTATVQFAAGAGSRSFRLALSPLRPVQP
jgi:DNA helicase II / ATP-dependent DNA helicase PcrA